MIFQDKFMSLKKLEQGKFYIAKDGRLLLYLGIVKGDHYAFYPIAHLYIEVKRGDNYEYVVDIIHDTTYIKYLQSYISELLARPVDKDLLILRKTIDIYGAMPIFDFHDGFDKWIDMQQLSSIGITLDDKKNGKKAGWVPIKEMQIGRVYKSTDSGWRSTFVYLGKVNIRGAIKYAYYFVGNDTYLNTASRFSLGFDTIDFLKSPKKLKLNEYFSDVVIPVEWFPASIRNNLVK